MARLSLMSDRARTLEQPFRSRTATENPRSKWIPAFAGMAQADGAHDPGLRASTGMGGRHHRRHPGEGRDPFAFDRARKSRRACATMRAAGNGAFT
jgi:hypothetical protein